MSLFSNFAYPKYKLAIVLLLTINVIVYAMVDTLASAVDALIWLVLLVMYELEANGFTIAAKKTLHRLRIFIIVVILLVFVSYVHTEEWLDVVNAVTWFALIALLEVEVQWPNLVFKYQQLYRMFIVVVFSSLLVMVFVWLSKSAWLDAYDAALWLIAFASIEVDIFHLLQRNRQSP